MNWDETFAVKARNGEVEVGLGASDQVIAIAQQTIGSIPTDYRLFLSKFGYASFGSDEIFGLGDDVPRYLNVVEISLAERRESHGFPADGVVIFNDGGGNLYYLRDLGDGKSPVYSWLHDDPRAIYVDSPSFAVWLLARLP
jgi:hypothetical protein